MPLGALLQSIKYLSIIALGDAMQCTQGNNWSNIIYIFITIARYCHSSANTFETILLLKPVYYVTISLVKFGFL